MTHKRSGEKLTVINDGDAGAYIMVPPEQVKDVLSELRSKGITAIPDHAGITVDGEIAEVTINLGKVDPVPVQEVLDEAEFGKADTLVMGMGVAIKVRNRSWGILIRRTDEKPEGRFSDMHGKLVSAADVRDLIPGFAELVWTDHLAALPRGQCESRAVDEPFRISLLYPSGSDPTQIKGEFTESLAVAPY